MTLVWDARNELQGRQGVHALIAGVSSYRHLPGGSGKLTDDSYGLRQLSSTALTAYRIYRWILDRKDRLPLPLATVRLLLSPSATELATEPEMATLAAPCTRSSFVSAAKQWRDDASSNREGMTFFYFAGHGVQRKVSDAIMLPEDFGDPNEGPLRNAVPFDNLFHGMAPSSGSMAQIARKQIYFIDTCRDLTQEMRDSEWQEVSGIWRVSLGGLDDRHAPVFFSAIPGSRAYALKGRMTFFGEALLGCLEGAGADTLSQRDSHGRVRWAVSVYPLDEALRGQMAKLNESVRVRRGLRADQPDQHYDLTGHVHNLVLHYLDDPPEVDVMLTIKPTDALPFVRLEVTDVHRGSKVWTLEPIDPHPYENKLRAGIYQVNAKITDTSSQLYSSYEEWHKITPPWYPVTAMVS